MRRPTRRGSEAPRTASGANPPTSRAPAVTPAPSARDAVSDSTSDRDVEMTSHHLCDRAKWISHGTPPPTCGNAVAAAIPADATGLVRPYVEGHGAIRHKLPGQVGLSVTRVGTYVYGWDFDVRIGDVHVLPRLDREAGQGSLRVRGIMADLRCETRQLSFSPTIIRQGLPGIHRMMADDLGGSIATPRTWAGRDMTAGSCPVRGRRPFRDDAAG
jgi:hypothetical protein